MDKERQDEIRTVVRENYAEVARLGRLLLQPFNMRH
jgi:hypothetical protein